MDESAVFEIINGLRNQIAEVKGQMREQHRQEIERIEAAHENEKTLLEQKCQEEIGGYQDIITQQKGELNRLERENGKKDETIGQIESRLIEKDNELQQKLGEMKTKNGEYDFLQTRFDEKVEELRKLNGKITTKEQEIFRLNNEIRDLKQDKTTMQTTINNKNAEINRLNNFINDKEREIKSLQTNFENEQNECKRLNKYINEQTICLPSCKGNYNDVRIHQNILSEDRKDFALEITRKSLNMHGNNHFECAKYIKRQFDDKYGGHWGVSLALRNNIFGSVYFDHFGGFINFYMGEFFVNIFLINSSGYKW